MGLWKWQMACHLHDPRIKFEKIKNEFIISRTSLDFYDFCHVCLMSRIQLECWTICFTVRLQLQEARSAINPFDHRTDHKKSTNRKGLSFCVPPK